MNERAVVQEPTDAEQQALDHKDAIIALARSATITFLEMGRLLWIARENAHWSTLGQESFDAYVEDLGLPMGHSPSWVSRLIGIHEFLVLKKKLTQEELLEIGVSKAVHLLPKARRKELTNEDIAKAKIYSERDLRIELGQEGLTVDMGKWVINYICSRCGEHLTIRGARWVKKAQDEPRKEG